MNPISERPLVSVVIVSWNAKRYLEQCLQSLKDGVCAYPMEVIVVDNASADGSAQMVSQSFPAVRLIRSTANLGFAKGNNLGIRASRGEYICLVNSDVRVLPDCITKLVDYCREHPRVGMVGPRIIGGDGNLQRSCRGFPTLWNMFCRALALDALFPRVKLFGGFLLHYWDQETLRRVDILSGCFWLVRRQALNAVGPLDENFFMYAEDFDWCRRFWNAGWELMFVPGAEAIHYGGASSSNAPVRFFIEKQRADLQYWSKHHSRVATMVFFAISCVHLLVRAAGYGLAWLLRRRLRESCAYKLSRSLACLRWMFTRREPSTSSRSV